MGREKCRSSQELRAPGTLGLLPLWWACRPRGGSKGTGLEEGRARKFGAGRGRQPQPEEGSMEAGVGKRGGWQRLSGEGSRREVRS